MSGSRALTNEEHELVIKSFTRRRDECLYILHSDTGFRISEMLIPLVKDVYQKDYLTVTRKNMKGKIESRTVKLTKRSKESISLYLASWKELDMNAPLFISRQGDNKAIGRVRVHQIYKAAYKELNLQGKVSTHSNRKRSAEYVYEKSGHDILLTLKWLGHSSVLTTMKYLPVNQKRLDKIMDEE
jgi:site-specific recombinase XerD